MPKTKSKYTRCKPHDEYDNKTKQAFRDDADINQMLAKAQKAGTISHIEKHGAEYGDFTDMPDLLTAHQRMARGVEIFNELPSEVRREFGQDPGAFFKYVNDPANKDDLVRLLPGLARPGSQLPNPAARQDPGPDPDPEPPADPPADTPPA